MMWEIKNCAKCQSGEPEIPENAETLDFYVYSDVDKKWWSGDDCVGAQDFQKVLDKNPDAKNINIYINSYGGSVMEGVAIYSQLKRHKAFVTAYIDGFACSIASVIPMAADKVVMSDAGMMMIHNPWTFAMGNSKDMRKCADDLDKILEGSIIPAYKNKINGKITDEKLIELIDNAQMMTARECVEYGFADEIVESAGSKEDAMNKYNEFVNSAKTAFMNGFDFGSLSAKAVPVPKAKEEPAPAPDPAEEKPEENPVPQPEENPPVENKHDEANEIFMKMLKGEMYNE